MAAAGTPQAADARAAQTWQLARDVLVMDTEQGWNLLHTILPLNIRTIDGFCGALTRQMPVLSRFGGPIAAVDDAGPYHREATHGLLEQLEQAGPGADDLGDPVAAFRQQLDASRRAAGVHAAVP